MIKYKKINYRKGIAMTFSDMTFVRKFSMNFYKNLKISTAKMTFTSDFTDTERGDLYPIIKKDAGLTEYVRPAGYTVSGSGSVERLFCSFFPWATYEIGFESLDGKAGFVFFGDGARAEAFVENDAWETFITVRHGGKENKVQLHYDTSSKFSLIVTSRPGAFDVYVSECGNIHFLFTEQAPEFQRSNVESFYKKAKVSLILSGNVSISSAEAYVDCGVAQADIRPFRYENGELIEEDGRVFLSISARQAVGCYQAILSWLPGTCDFKMEGAVFYSNGDGKIHGEVAASYVYNREDGKWHVWVRNAAAGHVLSYATFDYDVRYGINVLDVNPLPLMTRETLDDFALLGKKGDEDPDFTYDEKRKKWLFALCRIDEETKKYRYFFFESDKPGCDYKFVGLAPAGEETGGSIVRLDGKIFFICGNNFTKKSSEYRVYEWGKFDTFTNLKCDYSDGGFRGWGTVMPVRRGSRTTYFWLTFDRTLLSKSYNWSYGNIYCFEGVL